MPGENTNFVERVKATNLPLDKSIVIGSGILAAYGIRDARDIDVVVEPEVFAELENEGVWHVGFQGSSSYALQKDDIEVWADWSTDGSGHPTYADLLPMTIEIEGVRFVTLDYVEQRKRERGSEKDIEDIRRIHEYRAAQ